MLTNVILVKMDTLLKRHQIKLLLYVKKILAILPIVPYVMLEVIHVSNVLINIMFGTGVKVHVFLISVLSKTVINVKLTLKNVNNVKVDLFHTFLLVDAQPLQ